MASESKPDEYGRDLPKIWAVHGGCCEEHGGGSVLAVFDSEEKAEAGQKLILDKNSHFYTWVDDYPLNFIPRHLRRVEF